MAAYLGCHLYNDNTEDIIKPATDVFEINDFTAATSWENFIDDIENILRNLRICEPSGNIKELDKTDFLSHGWTCQKKNLKDFNEFPFTLYHYQVDDEDSNPVNSAPDCPDGARLAVMFGLTEFLLIGPAGQDTLCNDTRAKMVLGAVNIALTNTGCALPCLVQVMDPRKELYVGSRVADNARTEMSSVCLNKRPTHCSYLAGLLELYRNKINSPLPVPGSTARVSARLSYSLEDWASFSWGIDPPDLDIYNMSGDTDFIQLAKLPFGCVSDPIAGLTLHTTWRDMSEDLVTDTEVHTDLDPLEAPDWSVEVSLVDKPECLLAKHLDKHLALCSDTRTVRMLIGELLEESEGDAGMGQVLDKMTGTGGSYGLADLSGLVRPLRRSPTGGPLKAGLLKFVLGYLFPDSEVSSQHLYGRQEVELAGTSQEVADLYTGTVKTAPPDSLVWRLSLASACCLQWAGAAGVAHMWHEVCLEVRFRLENSLVIPGLPGGLPDTSYCLLLQKLQMLNCCVARKLARERAAENSEDLNKRIDVREEDEDTEEDEFFECEEEVRDDKKRSAPAWAEAEGRVGRIGELRLLEVDDWMYRPEVQDPAPVTEDQLAELSEVMMQLGTDQVGAEIRAKMQSANLMSDMESFKAANPGCVLADFVRWHSPRDWDPVKGLSCRMRSEGNIWTELWEQARIVPARRQRRLFDDTKEAEKVMSYLTGLSPGDVASLLHPVLLQAAHLRLLEAGHDCEGEEQDKRHEDLVQSVISLARLQSLPEVRHYRGEVEDGQFKKRRELSSHVSSLFWLLEMKISRSLSLRKKFLYDLAVLSEEEKDQPDAVREMERFVTTLATGTEVRVLGAARGPAGRLIQSMFRESEQEDHPREGGLPPPCSKQFVLRSLVSRPFPYSRPQPQRLYVKICPGEFRLAGSFAQDRQFS